MKCLVCDNQITINTLSALFNPEPLLLCTHCNKNLITPQPQGVLSLNRNDAAQIHLKKEANILYEQNDWLLDVISRLNQGDLELRKIFFTDLKKVLNGHLDKKILLETGGASAPQYPWLELLATDIGVQMGDDSQTPCLILSVSKIPSVDHNISII